MPARAIRHPVLLLQEGDIADNKDAGLANRPQILDRALRADQPVASAPAIVIGLSPRSIAANSGAMPASPSPFSTQSMPPAPCSMKRVLVDLARSTISGTCRR